jgi:hypothetical protein
MTLKQVFSEETQCRTKEGHLKRTFHSKADAKRAAKQAPTVMGGGSGRGMMEAYKCPHCGFFHIGHARPRSSGK